MKKTYYKLVNAYNTLHSSNANLYWPHEFAVYYNVDQWVEPNIAGSKIFVFDNIADAKAHQGKNNYCTVIFECVVKNPHRVRRPVCTFFKEYPQYWKAYLTARKNKKKMQYDVDTFIAPNGSYWCNAVKLTKQVQ